MKTERGKRYRNEKIKLYVLITVVSIVLLAWLLVVVIVFQKNHADIFSSTITKRLNINMETTRRMRWLWMAMYICTEVSWSWEIMIKRKIREMWK